MKNISLLHSQANTLNVRAIFTQSVACQTTHSTSISLYPLYPPLEHKSLVHSGTASSVLYATQTHGRVVILMQIKEVETPLFLSLCFR
jgi:hypothetical protein